MGWVTFPARTNGWAAHRYIRSVDNLDLREVPLWLSFNTGLPAAVHRRRLVIAA